jgi:hypothetical protein
MISTSGLLTHRTSQFYPVWFPFIPPILLVRTPGFFASSNVPSKVYTTFLKCEGAELLSSPAPVIDLSNLLLDLRLLSPCRRSIALAETFATTAISTLDEAGSQVVAPAIAADKFLRSGASDRFHLGTFCLGLLSSSFLADLFGRSLRRIPLSTLRRRMGGLI